MSVLIALLTDFGTHDWYVAAMKGKILGIAPHARLVDITHAIPPGDIAAGAFALEQCWQHFPQGTLFLGVVDPGVGTSRKAIALRAAGRFFVGPDNGLFSSVPAEHIREITNAEVADFYASNTFHGRDIFAPAAAHLAAGKTALERLGPVLPDLHRLPLLEPSEENELVLGAVRYIDHYGNAITNLPGDRFPPEEVGGMELTEPSSSGQTEAVLPAGRTFGDAAPGEALAYVGSGGLWEIAVNGGSAAERFSLKPGAMVSLRKISPITPKRTG